MVEYDDAHLEGEKTLVFCSKFRGKNFWKIQCILDNFFQTTKCNKDLGCVFIYIYSFKKQVDTQQPAINYTVNITKRERDTVFFIDKNLSFL